MFSYKSEFFKSKGLFRLDQLYIERWGNIIVTEVSLGFKSCLNVMPVFFIFHVFLFFFYRLHVHVSGKIILSHIFY